MFIIKQEIKESIRKLRRAWSCCWLINPLVYGNISRAGGQLEEERIKIFFGIRGSVAAIQCRYMSKPTSFWTN